jgi:hypothetical protein
MFYKKLKVDNESGRRGGAENDDRGLRIEDSVIAQGDPRSSTLDHRSPRLRHALIHCAAALLVLIVVTPHAWAQKTAGRKPKTRSAKETTQDSKEDAKKLAEAASQSRANLLSASSAYLESLEKLLELQRQDESRATEIVGRRKELLALGVIAKRELEEGERALAEAQGKIAETTKRIAEVDQLVAEVNAAEEDAKTSAERPGLYSARSGLVVRYAGASHWALGDLAKVEAFFRLKFAKPLPVSAVGQTETHNQLGFDHREAVDVAVHPDSAEGQALIGYLASQGVSFIAIRGAIPGSATGAHIHIGPPSKRIAAH